MASERRLQVLSEHLVANPTAALASSSTSKTPQQFKYTVDNNLLTTKERAFYEENGFLLVKGLVSQADLTRYKDQFIKLCNKEVEPPSFMTLMRDLSIAKSVSKDDAKGEYMIAKAQHFEQDEVLFSYCQHPDILKYVECFTGPNIKTVHTMLINKPPNAGASSRHPLHQDLHYFSFRPADRIVAAWTAMEKCTIENGCLQVLPGTHTGELLEHGYPEYEGAVNMLYHGVKGLDKFAHVPRVHLEMDAGDTVFFHPILIHGSGPNNTQGFRKAISCHYASSDCTHIDVRGTTQETMLSEFSDLLKKIAPGFELSFQEFWSYKARLVAGREGTL